jgi:osmotically-inducible protein OsmY
VTLTGFVHHHNGKTQAERATKWSSVSRASPTTSKCAFRMLTNARIRRSARDAVAARKRQLPAAWEHIMVSVSACTITLEGDVEWHYQSEMAEQTVRPLKGVTRLKNQIRIVSKAMLQEIKRRIQEAFRQSAEVDAAHGRVEANGGGVILRGTVRSGAEREEVERAAWAIVLGVASVVNQIVVRA